MPEPAAALVHEPAHLGLLRGVEAVVEVGHRGNHLGRGPSLGHQHRGRAEIDPAWFDEGTEGLIVLAVPSNDFRQELGNAAEVKEFCAVNFDLTIPMTDITPILGTEAHPFFAWLAAEHDFVPGWNFNKYLVDARGRPAMYFPSSEQPDSPAMRKAINA